MSNVVIGGASGIGRAVAAQLVSRGHLLLADRSLESLDPVAAEIGGNVETVACDISDPDQIEALFARVDNLEALIVTAGLSGAQGTAHTVLDVNLRGTARVMNAAEMKLRAGSVGVFLASASGYRTPEDPALMEVLEDPLADDFFDRLAAIAPATATSHIAYSASKRGVMRLIRQRAFTWGKQGARILSVSPSLVATPMSLNEESRSPIMKKIAASSPIGRRGRPEEVANVISFLTSPLASYMTGCDILVDGGIVLLDPVRIAADERVASGGS